MVSSSRSAARFEPVDSAELNRVQQQQQVSTTGNAPENAREERSMLGNIKNIDRKVGWSGELQDLQVIFSFRRECTSGRELVVVFAFTR